jgi:hypothetical protein
MRKRELFWIVVLILTGWAYVHFFSGWGEQPKMVVTASLRPSMNRGGSGMRRGGPARDGQARGGVDMGTNFPVLFELLNPYKLTSLKVVEVETNQAKAPEHILWHLVSTNGSDPVKTFFYGRVIQGMDPYLPGVTAEALLPNVMYRLDLEAGKVKGSTTFQTIGKPQ